MARYVAEATREVAMQKVKNRRGVFVVLFGILFMTLMASAAIAVDFSRIWSMRNELQTSADAAALAGAVQLGTANKAEADIQAASRAYAAANPAMGAAVVVNEVITGQWVDANAPNGFTGGATPTN